MPVNPSASSLKLIAFLGLSLMGPRAFGQTATQDTQLDLIDVSVPCPTSFAALYYDSPLAVTFWGGSTLIYRPPGMASNQYFFVGQTRDGDWQISGDHFVADNQCADAWVQKRTGVPAIILRLHEAHVTYLGSLGGGGGGGCPGREDQATYDPYSSSEPQNGGPSCGGGGSGGGGSDPGTPPPAPDGSTPPAGGGSGCEKQYLVLEVSDDGGQTWYTYWEGEVIVCG